MNIVKRGQRDAPSASAPDALERFVALFNRGDFWQAHEVLESAWRTNASAFYHGLILYASAYVHVLRQNPRGIDAQFGKAERVLPAYRPFYLGVDVNALTSHAALCRARVAAESGGATVWWPAVIPPITMSLDDALVRGDEPELGAG